MAALTRWIAPVAVALGLGMAALMPAPARASDDLVRIIVDVADIIYHRGNPYYRHGNYGPYDRIVVVRDYRGRPNYYRHVPRSYYTRHHGSRHYRSGPPYGVAHGYYGTAPGKMKYKGDNCDRKGRCKVSYYDPRRDDRRYDRRDSDRRWDGRRRDDRRDGRRGWGG